MTDRAVILSSELVLPEDAPDQTDAPAPLILAECGTVNEDTAAEVLVVKYGAALYRFRNEGRIGHVDEATGRWISGV